MTIVLGLTADKTTSLYVSELEPKAAAQRLVASHPGAQLCPLMADYLVLDASHETRFRVIPFAPDTWKSCMQCLAETDPVAALLL